MSGLDRSAARLLKLLAAQPRGPNADIPSRRAGLEGLADLDRSRLSRTRPTADFHLPSGVRVRRHLGGAAPIGLVFAHGGGFTTGSVTTHAALCDGLAAALGGQVFSVDYRLAPEHPFPAGLTDVLELAEHLNHRAIDFGLDPRRIALGGDSAGGALAAAATARLTRAGRAPALQVLICPILTLARRLPSRDAFAHGRFIDADQFDADAAAYLADGAPADDPDVSPLEGRDVSGLPPTMVELAEEDPFRDEGGLYAERLREAGVAVETTLHPGQIHYFYALPGLIPAAADFATSLGGRIRARLGGPGVADEAPSGA